MRLVVTVPTLTSLLLISASSPPSSSSSCVAASQPSSSSSSSPLSSSPAEKNKQGWGLPTLATTTTANEENQKDKASSSSGTGPNTTTTIIRTMRKCFDVPQFTALQMAANSFHTDDKLHLRHLCSDSVRCAGLVAIHKSSSSSSSTDDAASSSSPTAASSSSSSDKKHQRRIILDYSRQQVTGETMELLFDLADKVGFTDLRYYMRAGYKINTTEGRSVLHHVLRMPREYDFVNAISGTSSSSLFSSSSSGGGGGGTGGSSGGSTTGGPINYTELLQAVHTVRDQIETFTTNVRSGKYRSSTGMQFTNVICIGIGGSCLGPQFVREALRADSRAAEAAEGRTLKFLSNVDPVDFTTCMKELDPGETLVVVISKTFTTAETMLNARTVRRWLLKGLASQGVHDEGDVIAKHFVAVTACPSRASDFGIIESNVFAIWDWVGGRFSVTSAVGVLPLSLQYSYPVMCDLLRGAHDLDEHFFDAPLRDNIPVILGLLGVWNATFMGYETRAVLPYSQALHKLPAHVQQVDMESNGKRVTLDGTPLPFPSGEINFGEAGTNGQHSFYQLLHQGRVVPVDFIGFCESQTPVELDGEAVSNHDELMSNFFAQPDALAYGKTLNDLIQEGVPEELRQHKVFPGNRPSSSMLLTKLDAFAVGQILAIYEHRTAVQGFIWGINSFDQWGVELGKVLARQVRSQLNASRKSSASVQGFNSSTSSLLEAYLSHGK